MLEVFKGIVHQKMLILSFTHPPVNSRLVVIFATLIKHLLCIRQSAFSILKLRPCKSDPYELVPQIETISLYDKHYNLGTEHIRYRRKV